MLTFLPKNLANMPRAFPGDRKLRLADGGHLFAASVASGVSRYLQQSCGFWIKPKSREHLGTEDDPFELQATPNIASGSDMYRQLEEGNGATWRPTFTFETPILGYGTIPSCM